MNLAADNATGLQLAIDLLRAGQGDDNVLLYYVEQQLGHHVPRVSVCPGHSNPAEFLCDGFFERVGDCLAVADRGGAKTQTLADVEHCELRFEGLEEAHVAATLNQGDKCLSYVQHSFRGLDRLLTSDVARLTRLYNGGELRLLTGTAKGVNAPHPVKVGFDEAELSTWEVLQEAQSMPMGTEAHRSAMRIITSWKFAHGIATKLIEEAVERGLRLYFWCVFETIERCQLSSCAGCEQVISYDRFGVKHTFADRCQGKARKADGYKRIEDVHRAFRSLDYSVWLAQWECQRPESVGQYYANFQRQIHCIDPDMTTWRPEHALHEGMPPGIGIDFGVSDPNAFVIALPAGPPSHPWRTAILVDGLEDRDGDTTIKTWPDAWALANGYGEPDPLLIVGDSSGRGRVNALKNLNVVRQVFETYGIKINSTPRDKSLTRRHDVIENRLRIRSDGEPRLYVWMGTKGGRHIAKCLESMRRPLKDGIPVGEEFVHDENSHTATAVEFLFLWIDDVLKRGPSSAC